MFTKRTVSRPQAAFPIRNQQSYVNKAGGTALGVANICIRYVNTFVWAEKTTLSSFSCSVYNKEDDRLQFVSANSPFFRMYRKHNILYMEDVFVYNINNFKSISLKSNTIMERRYLPLMFVLLSCYN